MSVPDPAPLPRLGEVFFDVRGNSRSMRLSWYADTGVAVFSIWQAGMCTGTFRLPIADLGRMVELLQRGPAPKRRGPVPVAAAERVDPGFDEPSGHYRPASEESGSGSGDDLAAFIQGDFAGEYNAVDYQAAGHRGGAEQPGQQYQGGDYRADREADYGTRGYREDDRTGPGYATDYTGHGYRDTHESQYRDRDYPAPGYGPADRSQPGYPSADQRADYDRGDYRTDGGYAPPSYESADYRSRSHGPGEPEYVTGDYSTGGYSRGQGADQGRDYLAGGVGYRDDRVVPPYVQDQEPSYLNDNWAPTGGYQGDIGDPAYPADRQPVSPSHGYREPSDPQDSYSYGSDYRYRLAADPEADAGNSVGRSGGRRAG